MFFLNTHPSVRKILFVFFLGALVLGGWMLGQRKDQLATLRSVPDHSIITWELKGESLEVEVVNTPASIEQGLSGREKLEVDGMLFVFTQPTRPIFWMKEMRFPIDIIWITNGKIVGFEENVSPPKKGETTDQLETFLAPQSVDMVLETRPGRVIR